jgi:hypothetical protein
MLDRCDRLQIAVADRRRAARTFMALLGAEPAREAASAHLAARITVLALGESEIELCQPDGDGRTQDHLDHHGEGLMRAGYSTPDIDRLAAHLEQQDAAPIREDGRLFVGPPATPGLPMVISPSATRSRVGPVSFLYETTNTLRSDWHEAAAIYARLFGLDASRFSPIGSRRFGYEGTLTLFDPPHRLDRIELSQVTGQDSAMGRFVERRGDSLYMAYVETHDLAAVKARLIAAGARYTPRGDDPAAETDGLWVHPKDLHGLLLGVSRTGLAWHWSGRPELVPPRPA